ncbi:MAG: SDR family oxidoreductase, partial [Natronosporangium sp.]
MTRALVTGAGGMLGHALVSTLEDVGKVTAADRTLLDITDPVAVAAAVAGHDIVVNAAGWTDVDGAEAAEDAATAVNGHAVAGLARACAASRAVLVQISTDYVFDGTARTPYPETAPTSPVTAYGRGKLVGERAVRAILPATGYVVRTAWLYGAHGGNFVATVRRLAAQRPTLDVVDDQHGA